MFENVERWMTESLVYYMLAYKSVHTKCDSSSTEMLKYEPVHGISNNLICATSKASDQPAHTRSLIRDFACRLSIL